MNFLDEFLFIFSFLPTEHYKWNNDFIIYWYNIHTYIQDNIDIIVPQFIEWPLTIFSNIAYNFLN